MRRVVRLAGLSVLLWVIRLHGQSLDSLVVQPGNASPVSGYGALLLGALVAMGARAGFLQWKTRRLAAITAATLESTADGILIVSPTGGVICFNRRFLEMWHLPESLVTSGADPHALGDTGSQLKDPEIFYSKVRQLYAAPEAESDDLLEFKDGRAFERHSKPLRTGRKVAGRVWRFRDISGQTRAEKALSYERSLLRTLVDSLPDYIYAKDLESRFLLVNTPGARMMGAQAPEELLGKTDFDFYPEELASQYRADEVRLFETGQRLIGRAEPCFEPATNTRKWILTNKVPFYDESGKMAGLIGSGRDITEIQRLTEQLVQAKSDAEEASRAKSEFLANMSHEIRTPMNGILGMTELALETDLTSEQREYMSAVKMSAESLLTVINDILDYSKVEAGKLVLERVEFQLLETLEETTRMLAPAAEQKGLELTCLIEPDVPACVAGDPTRVKQVVTNLLANAVKFTESGEVALEVRMENETGAASPPSESGPVTVHFTVRDTGIGIAEEKQQVIFQAFAQSDSSTTRRYGGTGLGLTISARFVEMMGGRIWVESAPGHGSRFHFTVPFEPAAEPCVPGESAPAKLDGVSVLVVDDNATNRRMLELVLHNWGMQVEAVEGGKAALEAVKRSCAAGKGFPLILVDCHMPQMDGFGLAEKLRDRPEMTHTAIVMLSSAGQRGDAARCRSLGIAAYLTKPIRQAELRDTILKVLGDASRGELVTRHSLREGRRNLRILLVEDNPINQKLGLRLLENYGHSVSIAGNGEEALDMLERNTFDLILMDIQMPKMGGFEAAMAIRAREEGSGRHQPIIAMTACAMKGDAEKCVASGMDGYVSKPVRVAELFDAIHAVLPNG